MLTPGSFGESQADPDLAHWRRKPRLRDQASAVFVVAAGSVAIPLSLAVAIPISIADQVTAWAKWKRSKR